MGTMGSIARAGFISAALAALLAGCSLAAPASVAPAISRAPVAESSPDAGCTSSRPDRAWYPSDGTYASSQRMNTTVCQSWARLDSLIVNRSDVVWALDDRVTELTSVSESADIFRTVTINQTERRRLVPFLAPGESAVVAHRVGRIPSFAVDGPLTALWLAQRVVEEKVKKASTAAAISLIGNSSARYAIAVCAVAVADAASTATDAAYAADLWVSALSAAALEPGCSRAWAVARDSVGPRIYPRLTDAVKPFDTQDRGRRSGRG